MIEIVEQLKAINRRPMLWLVWLFSVIGFLSLHNSIFAAEMANKAAQDNVVLTELRDAYTALSQDEHETSARPLIKLLNRSSASFSDVETEHSVKFMAALGLVGFHLEGERYAKATNSLGVYIRHLDAVAKNVSDPEARLEKQVAILSAHFSLVMLAFLDEDFDRAAEHLDFVDKTLDGLKHQFPEHAWSIHEAHVYVADVAYLLSTGKWPSNRWQDQERFKGIGRDLYLSQNNAAHFRRFLDIHRVFALAKEGFLSQSIDLTISVRDWLRTVDPESPYIWLMELHLGAVQGAYRNFPEAAETLDRAVEAADRTGINIDFGNLTTFMRERGSNMIWPSNLDPRSERYIVRLNPFISVTYELGKIGDKDPFKGSIEYRLEFGGPKSQ